eukprot:366116-Chlamydomonas_euryale.AAC.12
MQRLHRTVSESELQRTAHNLSTALQVCCKNSLSSFLPDQWNCCGGGCDSSPRCGQLCEVALCGRMVLHDILLSSTVD